MTTYYKIRSKTNPDMYRRQDGGWNKSGKVYDTLGKLRAVITYHLNNDYLRDRIHDWEIVEYEVQVHAVRRIDEIIDPRRLIDLLKR